MGNNPIQWEIINITKENFLFRLGHGFNSYVKLPKGISWIVTFYTQNTRILQKSKGCRQITCCFTWPIMAMCPPKNTQKMRFSQHGGQLSCTEPTSVKAPFMMVLPLITISPMVLSTTDAPCWVSAWEPCEQKEHEDSKYHRQWKLNNTAVPLWNIQMYKNHKFWPTNCWTWLPTKLCSNALAWPEVCMH